MAVNFEKFVCAVCKKLVQYAEDNPKAIAACNAGEKFELCVVHATKEIVERQCPRATVEYNAGSHAFPDIIVDFGDWERYGIEVKSSSSATSKGWKINGNSILGSTKRDVLDTYIIFGKTAIGHQEFRYKRYEDSVANVVVTHSPRYAIDLDLAPDETFFAKSGISYQEIQRSDFPIQLVTEYFKRQGLSAWWLTESAPAALRLYSDLRSSEQEELIGYCLTHFPELFSKSSKKFYRSAVWLTTVRSVIAPSLRDSFTAGGKADITTKNATYHKLPRIYTVLREHRHIVLQLLNKTPAEKLAEDWNWSRPLKNTFEEKACLWVSLVCESAPREKYDGHPIEDILLGVIAD